MATMKVVICILMCVLGEITQAERLGTDVTSDKLLEALVARIDQLEEKLEARERLHQMEMATQKDRINELEVTVREQHDRINELLNPLGDAPTSQEREAGRQRNATPVRKDTTVKLRNRIRRAEIEEGVAFFATLSTNLVHIGTNQTIAFDHEFTNIGNAYNPHVGSFVAPVSGTYVFSVTLMTNSRHVTHYALYRNSEVITHMYVNGIDNPYDTTSQMAVLQLAQGDDVTIKHSDSDHILNGYGYSMFSGFLLSGQSSPGLVGK